MERLCQLSSRSLDSDRAGVVRAVVPTFRRREVLLETLKVTVKTGPIAEIVVVNNGPDEEIDVVHLSKEVEVTIVVMNAADNIGPAGAIHLGINALLERSSNDDWILLIDDDDPPSSTTAVQDLLELARTLRSHDAQIGGVGLAGARYDTHLGMPTRVPTEELSPRTDVDWFGGNQLPIYSVNALRTAGAGDPELFFGFDDLLLGLRLRAAGFRLCVDGTAVRQRRSHLGHGDRPPSVASERSWRTYYAARNLVLIAREHASMVGFIRTCIRTAAQCIHPYKPNKLARARGLLHGILGWSGRRVQPNANPPKQPRSRSASIS